MKIKVINGFYIKSSIEESQDIYTLDIQIIEGKSVLPGQVYKSINNPKLSFTVKSLALGGYDFANKIFVIRIEKPPAEIKNYKDVIFMKE